MTKQNEWVDSGTLYPPLFIKIEYIHGCFILEGYTGQLTRLSMSNTLEFKSYESRSETVFMPNDIKYSIALPFGKGIHWRAI
jgi:hypothetical protein